MGGAVGLDAFEPASRIVAWHLNEARRFLGEVAIPPSLANAVSLDHWLVDYCRENSVSTVSRREVQRTGPNQIRQGDALDEALKELSEARRVRVTQDGSKKDIELNPALTDGLC